MKLKPEGRAVSIPILVILIFVFCLFLSSVLNIQNLNILSLPAANVSDVKISDSATFPVRIRIPKINVYAVIEPVGLTSGLAMDVPEIPANAGWFKLGVQPGEKGSAVIAGHYGWKDGIPAVFDSLNKLSKGDVLYIENNTRTTIPFIVREIRIYKMDDDASDIFVSHDGGVHLNLITCAGAWNKAAKTSSDRLVVFLDEGTQAEGSLRK